jgi:hypothetical protein
LLLRLLLCLFFYTTMKKPSLSFPVDAVFTWVDGNDPVWLHNRANALRNYGSSDQPAAEALSPARFQDNDEMRYALRSLALYVPWLRRVHVITAGQKPEWINTETVTIVDHKDILPSQDLLPVFSSRPIELCAHRIPGLAEHFICFNDDFMIGRSLDPTDFFRADGTPLVWAVRRGRKTMRKLLTSPTHISLHKSAVARSHHLIQKQYGRTFPIVMRHFPKSMTVSTANAVWETFPQEVQQTLSSRFRADTDIWIHMLYPLYLLATGQGILRPINGLRQVYDFFFQGVAHIGASLPDSNFCQKMNRIKRFAPLTFCLNDAPGSSEADRKKLKDFLHDLFPAPGLFEK